MILAVDPALHLAEDPRVPARGQGQQTVMTRDEGRMTLHREEGDPTLHRDERIGLAVVARTLQTIVRGTATIRHRGRAAEERPLAPRGAAVVAVGTVASAVA